MINRLKTFAVVVALFAISASIVSAQTRTSTSTEPSTFDELTDDTLISTDEASTAASITEVEATPVPLPSPRPDLTTQSVETTDSLQAILNSQELGSVALNPIKYAIRNAVDVGVPPNTIVLLLLLPAIAAIIAGARHLVGIRGFGIFLPAALSVVFLAIGPVAGIALFLVIVTVSTFTRILFRASRVKLQYLPRMALLLWFVVLGVLGVLFLAPVLRQSDLINVSIFPVLILVLLAEEFSKVQLGKSAKTAINLTTETLILALVSFIFLTMDGIQSYALLHPEAFLITVAFIDFMLGKFIGLRFIEYWKFRKLISG